MTLKEKILRKFQEDPKFNQVRFGKEIGCSGRYVRMVLKDSREASPKEYFDMVKKSKSSRKKDSAAKEDQIARVLEDHDSMEISCEGKNINTAEGAMEYCGVDPREWTIEKKVVNFWDSGKHRNWQIKVWLKKRSDLDAEAVINRLVERIPKFKYETFKPKSVKSKSKRKSGNLAVIANFDAHLGKLAWDVETGQGDYDLPISVSDYDYVAGANIDKCHMFNPEKFIYVIGQDQMHYENLEGVTPKGRNILDTDGRLSKLQDAAIDVTIRNVLKCRAVAPVEILLVQGNHDQTSSLWLAKVLRAWFRDDKYVTVDCEPKLRKARLWGKTFLGFAHKIMPTKIPAAQGDFSINFKEYWGKADYREILFGDQHKKMMWKTGQQITHGGILFRQLTALSKIDYWHYENLFTDACPGGEAFIYNKDAGCLANFTEWTYHRK